MAQNTHVGQQGLGHAMGPLIASAMLLMSLIFALLGIKIWGFKRRLNFERNEIRETATASASGATNLRYTRGGFQVNGTDNAVHGVFRQRNTDECEGARLSTAAAKYVSGSVPDLRLHKLEVGAEQSMLASPTTEAAVVLRQPPQVPPRRRRDVHSSSFDYHGTPPQSAAEPEATNTTIDLNMPNFEHFAQKFELLAVKSFAVNEQLVQVANKHSGGYVKYEQFDDDLVDLTLQQDMLTPDDDDQRGAALSVSALIHHAPESPVPEAPRSQQTTENGYPDSAFVVEIISDTADGQTQIFDPKLFQNLETLSDGDDAITTLSSDTDAEFLRIRSTCELNEADILDLDNLQMPGALSPPGFGKSIDEDWENFENLDLVKVSDVNWSLQPDTVEQIGSAEVTMSAAALTLDNVLQAESLFQQLEVVESEPEPEPRVESPMPPAYAESELPILPDYDSLMRLESMQKHHILPKYADIVPKYVSSIDDLYADLPTMGTDTIVDAFENLCEELEVVEAATPAPRLPPQPAPRCSRLGTLNARGEHAMPLPCYQPEELSSLSDNDVVEPLTLPLSLPPPPPQPAKRKKRNALRVRFDVDNLQYYQSAELPSSSESEEAFEQQAVAKPKPMLRLARLQADEANVPMLFGRQVSVSNAEEDSSDDDGWQAIRQHRQMTEQLQQQAATPPQGDTEA